MLMRASLKADLSLLGVSFAWGATFPVMKAALADASPLLYLVLRFFLASLLCLPLLPRVGGRPGRREMGAGVILGLLLAVSFALQTVGLEQIGPSRSAFLTSFYVILVPLFSVPLLRRVPAPASLAGALLAAAGLVCMTWDGVQMRLDPGDLLTLGGAVGFALHIIGVGVFTSRFPYQRLFVIQILAAAAFLLPMPALETVRFAPTPKLAAALLVTAGLATVLAFYVQNRVQSRTSPTRAAIIFAMEPVFAVICTAALAAGRTGLTLLDFLGAALILGGILLAEVRPAALRRR